MLESWNSMRNRKCGSVRYVFCLGFLGKEMRLEKKNTNQTMLNFDCYVVFWPIETSLIVDNLF